MYHYVSSFYDCRLKKVQKCVLLKTGSAQNWENEKEVISWIYAEFKNKEN